MQQINPIGGLVAMIQTLTGLSTMPVSARVLSFVIGALILGELFVLTYATLPERDFFKHIQFGVTAWYLMMVAVVPMTLVAHVLMSINGLRHI